MGKYDAEKVVIAGRELVCPVCGNSFFYERSTQLNTAGMTLLGLDWANRDALNFYCSNCGYMFWFHPLND